MKKEILICLSLIPLIFFSGCTLPWNQPLPTYKDDAITIEDYAVSTTEPYAGSRVTIKFLIQNNIEDPIKNVEVKFFDLSGFSDPSLDCGDGTRNDSVTCYFSELDSLDYKPIKITLKAPEEEQITAPTKFTVSFLVNYTMSSERSVMIPVVDGRIKTEPESEFLVSEQKHGPVRVDFDFPIKRIRKEDDREIIERWVVAGEPFEVKFKFKHTGTLRNVEPINITGDKIRIENKSIKIIEPCDFNITTSTSKRDITLLSTRERNLLKCNFNATETKYPEFLAELKLSYNYTYTFIKKETFTVKPPPF